MTDVPGIEELEIEEPAPSGEIRICAAPGCENPLPTEGPGWRLRRWCNDHQPSKNRKSGTTGKPRGRPRKDKAPPSIGAAPSKPTRSDDLARVEANAKSLIEWSAAITLIVANQTGKPLIAQDAVDIQTGAGPLAASLKEVARHEEWLRKALAGGQGSDRARAWVMLAVTVGTVTLPIWVRHDMLPAAVSEAAGGLLGAQPSGV